MKTQSSSPPEKAKFSSPVKLKAVRIAAVKLRNKGKKQISFFLLFVWLTD